MPPRRPAFRHRANGDLVFAATDRAKEVAALVSRQKAELGFGPQLSKEQVITRVRANRYSFIFLMHSALHYGYRLRHRE